MKKFKTIILISIMAMSLALSGCGFNKTDKGEKVQVPDEIVFGENVAAVAGSYEITMDDLQLYIDMIVPYIQSQTGSMEGWDEIIVEEGKTARDVIIEYALEEAKYQQIFYDVAKSEGLYSEEDNVEFTNMYIEESFGADGYEAFLAENGFTDEAFKKYVASTGAYYSICSEEKALEIYKNNYMTVKHILILFEGRDTKEDAYNEAMDIYNRAISGENFEQLIVAYNEDPGQSAETGYTFTEGTMVTEFYEASLALEEGEICEPVETSFGYHIIKRYPLVEAGTTAYEECMSTIANEMYTSFLNSEKLTAMIENNPLHINEDMVYKIDLSKYTTKSEAATE